MREWALERTVALLFSVMALLIVAHHVKPILNSIAWPQVSGQIIHAEVKSHGLWYETALTYEYTVNGHAYHNDRIRPVLMTHYELSREDAQSVVDYYLKNCTVDVYVSPQDPQLSTLSLSFGREPLEEWFVDFYMIFLAGLIGFGIAGFDFLKPREYGSDSRASQGADIIANDLRPRSKDRDTFK